MQKSHIHVGYKVVNVLCRNKIYSVEVIHRKLEKQDLYTINKPYKHNTRKESDLLNGLLVRCLMQFTSKDSWARHIENKISLMLKHIFANMTRFATNCGRSHVQSQKEKYRNTISKQIKIL